MPVPILHLLRFDKLSKLVAPFIVVLFIQTNIIEYVIPVIILLKYFSNPVEQ